MKHCAPGCNILKNLFLEQDQSEGCKVIDLVSFERVSFVEYACQIWNLYIG